MSMIAASAWADSIARWSGVFPIPKGGETSGSKLEKVWPSTYSISRVKPGLGSSRWRLEKYGNHPGRARGGSAMSVTSYSRYDMRVLVVRGREIKRTDSGVWFALSLALIFVVWGYPALSTRVINTWITHICPPFNQEFCDLSKGH